MEENPSVVLGEVCNPSAEPAAVAAVGSHSPTIGSCRLFVVVGVGDHDCADN